MGGATSKAVRQRALQLTPAELAAYFTGVWYEQVRTAVPYERGCQNSYQHFFTDGHITVINGCTDVSGQRVRVELTLGDALVPGRASFAVYSHGLRTGAYNIIYLEDDVAVVVGDSWRAVWVLTRSADANKVAVCAALARAKVPHLASRELVYNDGAPCTVFAPRVRQHHAVSKRLQHRPARAVPVVWKSRG